MTNVSWLLMVKANIWKSERHWLNRHLLRRFCISAEHKIQSLIQKIKERTKKNSEAGIIYHRLFGKHLSTGIEWREPREMYIYHVQKSPSEISMSSSKTLEGTGLPSSKNKLLKNGLNYLYLKKKSGFGNAN